MSYGIERETNKIVIYNHETDTIDFIADNWNDFIKELYDDNVYKTKNVFEYKYRGLRVIITTDEVKEEIIEKIGKPTIYVNKVNSDEIAYLNNELDNHLITIELYGLKLSYVTVDG